MRERKEDDEFYKDRREYHIHINLTELGAIVLIGMVLAKVLWGG